MYVMSTEKTDRIVNSRSGLIRAFYFENPDPRWVFVRRLDKGYIPAVDEDICIYYPGEDNLLFEPHIVDDEIKKLPMVILREVIDMITAINFYKL
jgi:hypothetical protein